MYIMNYIYYLFTVNHSPCEVQPTKNPNSANHQHQLQIDPRRINDIQRSIEKNTSISQEETSEPFRDILHQNACGRTKISEENLEHGQGGPGECAIISKDLRTYLCV